MGNRAMRAEKRRVRRTERERGKEEERKEGQPGTHGDKERKREKEDGKREGCGVNSLLICLVYIWQQMMM